MQQELQLESSCTQKDLFRNSNWKKFVHLILTLMTRHTLLEHGGPPSKVKTSGSEVCGPTVS